MSDSLLVLSQHGIPWLHIAFATLVMIWLAVATVADYVRYVRRRRR